MGCLGEPQVAGYCLPRPRCQKATFQAAFSGVRIIITCYAACSYGAMLLQVRESTGVASEPRCATQLTAFRDLES